MVSFFISDRIISQALAVVVLVALIYVVLRELPELVTIIEDVLYLLTGEDHDLQQLIE
jgi:exosortase/archaeosortase